MDLFQRSKAVRLRSHNDKYLLAEDDEERVSQHRNGTTRQARWQVELVQESQDQPPIIRLKSCYGKYLSASNEPFLLGVTGRKVLQVSPARRLDSSLEWEPIRDGFQVKLKTRYGQFLRANGGPPPWRNTVTHDIPHLHHDWVLWEVDIVEVRAYSPKAVPVPVPVPVPEPELSQGLESSVESSPSFSKRESFSSSASNSPQKSLSSASSGSPHRFHSRIINYMVANNDGYVEAGAEEFTFNFQGTSVEQLTQKLEEETELDHIIVCSRNPVNGKLCPLRLQLPPNKNTMNVVVLLASSKAAKGFAQQENLL